MKFRGELIDLMTMMWFGSTQKVLGKIFSYCCNTDISETRRKLIITLITLLIFGC